MAAGFRQAVRSGGALIGAFVKTASHQIIELMARTGLDFVIIDAEHAPFDWASLDRMAMGGAASGLAVLIRPPAIDPTYIGQALDLGFQGIVAPHVDDPAVAERLLAATRFDRGERGFSPSTRAAGYGAPDARAYREAADREGSVWCQIEDAAALPRLDAIAAIEDIDCLLLGRADLAMSLGVDSQSDPAVIEAVQATAAAGRRHGRAVGVYVGGLGEIAPLRALGISVFVCGSDQSWLLGEGRRLRRAFDAFLAG